MSSGGFVSIEQGRHGSGRVRLTVDVVVLPRLLVVVTTFPPPSTPPEVPLVLAVPFVPAPPALDVPFVPLEVALLLPVATAPAPAVALPGEAETAVVPVRTVCATVVVAEPVVAAACTSVGHRQ